MSDNFCGTTKILDVIAPTTLVQDVDIEVYVPSISSRKFCITLKRGQTMEQIIQYIFNELNWDSPKTNEKLLWLMDINGWCLPIPWQQNIIQLPRAIAALSLNIHDIGSSDNIVLTINDFIEPRQRLTSLIYLSR
jgi:hypothetical protein